MGPAPRIKRKNMGKKLFRQTWVTLFSPLGLAWAGSWSCLHLASAPSPPLASCPFPLSTAKPQIPSPVPSPNRAATRAQARAGREGHRTTAPPHHRTHACTGVNTNANAGNSCGNGNGPSCRHPPAFCATRPCLSCPQVRTHARTFSLSPTHQWTTVTSRDHPSRTPDQTPKTSTRNTEYGTTTRTT